MKYYILFLLFIFHIWLILQVNCKGNGKDKGKNLASEDVESTGGPSKWKVAQKAL